MPESTCYHCRAELSGEDPWICTHCGEIRPARETGTNSIERPPGSTETADRLLYWAHHDLSHALLSVQGTQGRAADLHLFDSSGQGTTMVLVIPGQAPDFAFAPYRFDHLAEAIELTGMERVY